MKPQIKEKKATVLFDASGVRTEHRATVVHDTLVIPYVSHSTAKEKRDHDAEIATIGRKLEARGAVIADYHALVGQAGVLGAATFKITDCQIEWHGPSTHILYLAWDVTIDGTTVHRVLADPAAEEPDTVMAADQILARVFNLVAEEAAAFLAETSRAKAFR